MSKDKRNPYQLPTGIDDGMQAIQRHDDEIAELTAERDALREALKAIMPMIEKTDEWNGQESMATKEYVQGLSDTLSEVYVFVDELLNKGITQ